MIIKSSRICNASGSTIAGNPENDEIIIIQGNLPMLEEEVRVAARMFYEEFDFVVAHQVRGSCWLHPIPRRKSRKR